VEEIIRLEPDPLVEEYLGLARQPVPGNTPEEKLENFMADLDYLPPGLYQAIREDTAREFGAETPKRTTNPNSDPR
jgi:hypothetical protein